MTNIRVLGKTAEGRGQGTIRIFKVGQENEAIAFMYLWIRDGAAGDTVCAIVYENGKAKTFLKGFRKTS